MEYELSKEFSCIKSKENAEIKGNVEKTDCLKSVFSTFQPQFFISFTYFSIMYCFILSIDNNTC